MDDESRNTMKQAIAALREGNIQEADNMLSKATGEAAQHDPHAAGESKPPEPPPPPHHSVLAFMREVSKRLGHPDALVHIADDFERATIPEDAQAADHEHHNG